MGFCLSVDVIILVMAMPFLFMHCSGYLAIRLSAVFSAFPDFFLDHFCGNDKESG